MDKPENKQIDLDRTEDKYIIPKEKLVEVKHEVETYLSPDYHEIDTVYCVNRSIYFDSPELTFLKQHLQDLDMRRKIRIRTYAPNGIPNHVYFIEIKSKNKGKSTKVRLQLSETGFKYIMQNYKIDIGQDLFITNIDMNHDDVEKEAKLINYLMITNKVKPVADVSYTRYAYQQDEEFRVTIDQNIKVKPFEITKLNIIQDLQNQGLWEDLKKYGEKFSNVEDFLLESKYHKTVPKWFEDMIDELDVEEKSFSKYVWAMYQLMNTSLKLVRG